MYSKKIDVVSEYESLLKWDEVKLLLNYSDYPGIVNDCDISLKWSIIIELILRNGSTPISDEDILDSLDLWMGINKNVIQYMDNMRFFAGEKDKILFCYLYYVAKFCLPRIKNKYSRFIEMNGLGQCGYFMGNTVTLLAAGEISHPQTNQNDQLGTG